MTAPTNDHAASSKPACKFFSCLFKSTPSFAPTILRLGLAACIFPHGAQKVLGCFGGYGWSATYDVFTSKMGVPGIVTVLVFLVEFIGPLLLILGIAVRPVALAFVGLMFGTILMSTGKNGFFMNWSGQQAGEGMEYALLAIAIATALIVSGAGALSVDRCLSKKLLSCNSKSE